MDDGGDEEGFSKDLEVEIWEIDSFDVADGMLLLTLTPFFRRYTLFLNIVYI